MPRSKNRRKKSARSKKSKPTKHVDRSTPAHKEASVSAELDEMCTSEYEEDTSGAGTMIQMRRLISGAQPAKEGFFSRRRTLGEWGLWLVGLVGIYYVVRHFTGE